jgi:hypothetical protein
LIQAVRARDQPTPWSVDEEAREEDPCGDPEQREGVL